ncbi:MAG: hypothetical protein ACXVLQ_10110 [Bacteriovorax sp.]
MKNLFLALFFVAGTSRAALIVDTMTGFSTSSDSKTSTSTSDVSNHTFIGASLGQRQRAYIGQNITFFSHSIKTSATDKISTLELGPRFTYFFTDENVFYTTLAWNPYAKGKRTVSNATEDISGYAFLAGIGAEVKMNRNFHIGGSLNYHTLNISKAISAANVATTVSDKYNSLMPMINLSFRFH